MPLISVIIPVYNGEKTIRETIESILNQTFSDFELIVINDGSTDTTLSIVNSIQDPRLKVFSYPNGGASASRNRGIARATGEYISFIDADDLWTPDKLEAQFKALQENQEAAVAYSWTNCIDESSKFLHPGGYITLNGDVYAHMLVVNFLICGSNPLIRRQALDEVGEFDKSLMGTEDWDMWLRLAARFHFVAVPTPQILYRQVADSVSSNIVRQEREILKAIDIAFARAPESLQHLKKPALANKYKYLIYKALQGKPAREKGFTAVRFLGQAILNDPSLLRYRVVWKVLLKAGATCFVPPQLAQALFTKFTKLANTSSILGYIKIQPF
ncbi:MAG: glycosyltransferase [Hormoscilla sp.]